MAIVEMYFGTLGPFLIDDTDPLYSHPQQSATRGEIPSVTSGMNTTVALAKLTPSGTDGSLTFTNGVLTSKVDPT